MPLHTSTPLAPTDAPLAACESARSACGASCKRSVAHSGAESRRQIWPLLRTVGLTVVTGLAVCRPLLAAEHAPIMQEGSLNVRALLQAGGAIGYLTIGVSVAMMALIIEHLLTIRRAVICPRPLAEELHQQLSTGQLSAAEQLCRKRPTFLSFLVLAGLRQAPFGYAAVEKAMEDTALEQAARLSRKVEYLSAIGALAPMLGLMGTVWGMIQAFAEFAAKSNPTPADFAPSISEALVTTLFGLVVAVPALAAYTWFRNRVDEVVSEASLTAEQVMSPLRRGIAAKPKTPAPTSAAGAP
ncbi:MotA/TolQ/ExbB proton channel family protein [Planctomicrobium sp. SH664]|uniref:MotA/TolQ/ExbB proton channel family protein n=1 Tax=Planctomicrobium sp. SH664 TaxID=3448125 RepID=UPI003F5BA421